MKKLHNYADYRKNLFFARAKVEKMKVNFMLLPIEKMEKSSKNNFRMLTCLTSIKK